MVRIVLGRGLKEEDTVEVPGVTLGEALKNLSARYPEVEELDVRVFVDGVEASRLEEERTPVGDEDTVLLTTY